MDVVKPPRLGGICPTLCCAAAGWNWNAAGAHIRRMNTSGVTESAVPWSKQGRVRFMATYRAEEISYGSKDRIPAETEPQLDHSRIVHACRERLLGLESAPVARHWTARVSRQVSSPLLALVGQE